MDIRFVAGFSPIVASASAARDFYGKDLGLAVSFAPRSDYSTIEIEGTKHFGLWTLRDAARSTFGVDQWPREFPVPQATLELEVDDVPAAVSELRERGVMLVQEAHTEAWGQVTARLISPDGLLIGITYTPSLRG
jgi:catechol 2,3-dioxygenase-like lactoylglutathione lyase family enzyme